MKPLGALGLALALVGALMFLALPGLRPVGGAMVLCGLALIVYSIVMPQRQRRRDQRARSRWEDDPPPGPQPIYSPEPGEVRARSNVPSQAPGFTSANPGNIPPIRQQASGGAAGYSTGHAEVPAPREREHAAAEYSPPPGQVQADAISEPPARPPGLSTALLPADDPDMPPMASPPPAPLPRT
jgi:hypothetical protein